MCADQGNGKRKSPKIKKRIYQSERLEKRLNDDGTWGKVDFKDGGCRLADTIIGWDDYYGKYLE